MKNKQILYILSSSNEFWGASKSFITMLDGIRQKGISPYVVLPSEGGLCTLLAERGIPFFIFSYRLSVYPPFIKGNAGSILLFLPLLLFRISVNLRAIIKLIGLCRRLSPALIHTNVGPLQIGYYAAKFLRIPHVWHIREYTGVLWHPLFCMGGFKKRMVAPGNHCIAITQGLFEYFKLGQENGRVIYNGILPGGKIRFTSRKEAYFLYAGRLDANKGIADLLAAFAEFTKRGSAGYKLLIAGDTANLRYKNSLVNQVQAYGLSDRVRFLGNRSDITDLMYKATALIVSSYSEGFGRCTAEALFNGCLVIGYNSTGTKEILEERGLGLLYLTPEELVSAMEEVTGKGIEHFFPMIKKGQECARALYSNERNAEEVVRYYEDILN